MRRDPARAVLSAWLLACLLAGRGVAQPGESPHSKLAPWVLSRTASGNVAEFLIVLPQAADLSLAETLASKDEKGRFVVDQLRKTAEHSQAPLRAWLAARGVPHRPFYIVNAIWARGDRALALALAERTDVIRVEGNPTVRVPLPEDLGRAAAPLAVESGIVNTGAPLVWAQGVTGQGIVVGGADTGVSFSHPALKPHYRGWNAAAGTASHAGNWHDAIHTEGSVCGADSPVPCDDNGHGSHTLGTAVGDDGLGNQIGMAPGARWIGCRNMDQGNGTPATYLECLEFFLAPYPPGGTPAVGDPSLAPDVTNNSWSCPPEEGCGTITLAAALAAQKAAGIFTVAAAGNSGPDCSTVSDPPAIHSSCYTVGALTTGTSDIAMFSSRGPVAVDGSGRAKPDIVAPGTTVRSAIPGGGYGLKSGTSMAAPHVAGAVALLWSARPHLRGRIDGTIALLNGAAVPIPSSACSSSGVPNNTFGYGRLDVKAAFDLLPPDLTRFFTVTPCRLVDTRAGTGPLAGPALAASTGRDFTLFGTCGIPRDARCLAANVVVVAPSSSGALKAFAAGFPTPVAEVLKFTAGLTRASNAVVCLNAGGAATFRPEMPSGVAPLVVDVVGYFK